MFRRRFVKCTPSCETIRRWSKKYYDRDTYANCGENERPQITAKQQDKMKDLFNQNRRIPLCYAAAETGVSRGTVWHFLGKELKLLQYHLQNGTEISHADQQNMVRSAEHRIQELPNDARYLWPIIFSDVCHISLSGLVNQQNCRVWRIEHPQRVYGSWQTAPLEMAWCAISENKVIGPYFFDNESVTDESHKRMLPDFSFPHLRHCPQSMISQQDGAPPHFGNPVR